MEDAYPYLPQFPESGRKHVRDQQIRCARKLKESLDNLPASDLYGRRQQGYRYMVQVFLAFAGEVFEMAKQGALGYSGVEAACEEFMRRLAIRVAGEHGAACGLSFMIDNFAHLRSEVWTDLKGLPEWQEYEDGLLSLEVPEARVPTPAEKLHTRIDEPICGERSLRMPGVLIKLAYSLTAAPSFHLIWYFVVAAFAFWSMCTASG